MTIKEAVKGNGYVPGIHSGSIKRAEKMLCDNETLIHAGIYKVSVLPSNTALNVDAFKIKDKAVGVIAITNRKVFFCTDTLGQGVTKQIPITGVKSVDDSKNWTGLVKIRIQGLTEMFIIDTVADASLRIQNALSKAKEMCQSPPGRTNLSSIQASSKADELIKLKGLLDSGILTRKEFDLEKRKILNG